jgi:hypothetical protein
MLNDVAASCKNLSSIGPADFSFIEDAGHAFYRPSR